MKNVALFAVLIAFLAFMVSCGGSAEPVAHDAAPADAAAPEAHGGLDFGLALNEGSKWEVDDHTRTVAAAMTRELGEAQPVASVEDARALGAGIDARLKELIQGCTMTGPAHDQLHIVIAELFPRIGKLKNGDDLAALQTTQEEIGQLFDAYGRYFE